MNTSTVINSFPGYEYKYDNSDQTYHNLYRGEDVGFGGYVYAEPGIYTNVALLDVQSMHPNSIISLNYLGEYTKNFKDILDARIAIKHKDFETARKMLDGRLAHYLDDESNAANLAQALKLSINQCYGMSSAKFDNPFRDIRNKNNIVALKGALFMIDLKHEVQDRGFTVAHIKTDSIKIPDATPDIIEFVMNFGKKYGYTFEHEATYERMCLINDAVYIAKYASIEHVSALYGKQYVEKDKDTLKDCKKHPGEWTATGKQFQVPYVFKTLFSKEPIEFADLCETKEVKSALYLDKNENLSVDEHNYLFIGKVGSFCPIKPGCGGGELLRESKDKDGNIKYDSAVGAKGYRWLEAEMVKELCKEDDIDLNYHHTLVDDAVDVISKYGDFEWFVSDDGINKPNVAECHDCPTFQDDTAPWLPPCGDHKYETCYDCPHFNNDMFDIDCGQGYDISNVIIMNNTNKK